MKKSYINAYNAFVQEYQDKIGILEIRKHIAHNIIVFYDSLIIEKNLSKWYYDFPVYKIDVRSILNYSNKVLKDLKNADLNIAKNQQTFTCFSNGVRLCRKLL